MSPLSFTSRLDEETKERLAIEEAIKEADKGMFVSSSAIKQWLGSWGTDNELTAPKPDVFLKAK